MELGSPIKVDVASQRAGSKLGSVTIRRNPEESGGVFVPDR
jgi:hypothetical protein